MKINPKEKSHRLRINVENTEARFCQLWPQAKIALELLREIQDNPAANIILATVKAAGDAVVRKTGN